MDETSFGWKLPKSLTTVTPLSKIIAAALFITFPFIGFYLGIKYQKSTSSIPPSGAAVATPLPSQSTTINLPPEINNTTLYYLKDSKLYKISPLTSTPTVFIDKVDTYAFSPDRKTIAYTKGYGTEESSDNNVNVFNLENNNTMVIPCGDWCVNRRISWSPHGSYILVDAGTGPEGALTVYDSATGKQLSSFGDGNLVWQDERTVFMTQRTDVDLGRPWGGGEGASLASIDIVSGKSEVIKKADATNDYRAIKVDDSCLYYSREQVDEPNDWNEPSKVVSVSFCFDLKTKTSKPVAQSEAQTADSILRNKVKQAFPEFGVINKNEILDLTDNPSYPGWVIMGVYHGGGVYNSDIVIFNLDDPRNTYKKLTVGAQITWH